MLQFVSVAVLAANLALLAGPANAAQKPSASLVGIWHLSTVFVDGVARPIPPGSKLDSMLSVAEKDDKLEFRFTQGGRPAAAFDIPDQFDGSLVAVTDPQGTELARVQLKATTQLGCRIESRSINIGVVPDLIEVTPDGKALTFESRIANPSGPMQKLRLIFRPAEQPASASGKH